MGIPSNLPGTGRGTATRSVVVEGKTGATGIDDRGNDRIKIGKDVARDEAQRQETMPGQARVAGRIAFVTVATLVNLAIYFDRDAGSKTREVEDIVVDRMLPTKL